jgi:hypothetical protein
VTLNILEGSSVQGNPSYDPDPLSVTAGDVVEVSNQDTVPYTATPQVVPDLKILNREASLTQVSSMQAQ